MKNLKIAISGELGSGKTVLSKKLNEALGIEIKSVGKIQRELAQKYGMTTLEFNKYMETHPEIDQECDDMVASYGNTDDSLIIDSRLAWNFVPNSMKIHLLVDSMVAAQRVIADNIRNNEHYTDINDAHQKLVERKESETLRFKQQYKLDINDFNNYNLIVDTSYVSPEAIFDKVMQCIELWKTSPGFKKIFLCPKSLITSNDFQNLKSENINSEIVSFVKKDSKYYVTDNLQLLNKALQNNQDFVECVMDKTIN